MPNSATKIIKNKAIVADDWTVLHLSEEQTPECVSVAEGKVIVPLKVWQAQRRHCRAVPIWASGLPATNGLKH